MPTKPCLTCGRLTQHGSRCSLCERAHDRARRPDFRARYGTNWDRRRAEAIEVEPWCHNPDCSHPDAGTSANPLSADHDMPLIRGGQNSVLVPMCKRCNSAKGGR